MVTNDERREVAAKLRELGGHVYHPDNVYELLAYALGVDDFEGTDELFLRLADLIEPSEPEVKYVAEVKVDGWRIEELAHDAAVELTGIDRDALLALADEMTVEKGDIWGWSSRIRKALGVDE